MAMMKFNRQNPLCAAQKVVEETFGVTTTGCVIGLDMSERRRSRTMPITNVAALSSRTRGQPAWRVSHEKPCVGPSGANMKSRSAVASRT